MGQVGLPYSHCGLPPVACKAISCNAQSVSALAAYGEQFTMKKNEALPVIEDEGFYSTFPAADYLGYKPTTVRNSRCKGILAGVKAPAFIKMGAKVVYLGKTLKEWRAQFVEKTRTAEQGSTGKAA